MNFEKLAEALVTLRKEAKAARYIRELMRTGQKAKTPGVAKMLKQRRGELQLGKDSATIRRWGNTSSKPGVPSPPMNEVARIRRTGPERYRAIRSRRDALR